MTTDQGVDKVFSVQEYNSSICLNLDEIFLPLKNIDEYTQTSVEKEIIEVVDMSISEEKIEETYIATLDMSHYTNETGYHVPKYEGGARDRKGNPLIAYDSIAIPKNLYSKLPYGSEVKIVTPEGEVYYGKAVDTGSVLNKLNRIDRCVATYKEADDLGVIKDVKIYRIG